jgi:hypothetical protein
MTQNRIEQIPEEYREDLNPDYEEGENHGPPRYETRPASEWKEIYDCYPELTDDILKQIPILVAGSRLEQGASYLDLHSPERGPFRAMGYQTAGPQNWYVPHSEVDHELWNRLEALRPDAVPCD